MPSLTYSTAALATCCFNSSCVAIYSYPSVFFIIQILNQPGIIHCSQIIEKFAAPDPMKNIYLEKIKNARVYDVAEKTPLEYQPILSARLNNRILLKREDTQPVFSFKLRGAYNKMINLPKEARDRGVIAASAGNHAQGVALAAKKLGCRAVIVMPTTTPQIKVDAVQSRGAEVVLY